MSDTKYPANREFDVFITGASQDTVFVESVADWLSNSCGFKVAPPQNDIGQTADARIFVLILSRSAIASVKLMELMDLILRETSEHRGLRFVALIRDDLPVEKIPQIIAEIGFVHVNGERLKANDTVAILEAMYPPAPGLDSGGLKMRDVYFSRTWRKDKAESEPADQVCAHASKYGFRLIGDTEDPEFDPDVRLPMIMAGCGAFITVLPYRSEPCATSEWMLEELRLASAANLPCLIVKDPRVPISAEISSSPNVVGLVDYLKGPDWTVRLDSSLQTLDDSYRQPENPADVLYLNDDVKRIAAVNTLVYRITAMALTTLNRPLSDRRALLELVQNADVVLCDLTHTDIEGWIAAGCAIALGRKMEILMPMPDPSGAAVLPFMTVHQYTSELDRFGQLHRIFRRHRRKVMNSDLGYPAGQGR